MTSVGTAGFFGILTLVTLFAAADAAAQGSTPQDRAIETARMMRMCVVMTGANRHYADVPPSARDAYCSCFAAKIVELVPLAALRGPGTPKYDGAIKTAAQACYRPLVPYLKD